VCLIVSSRPFSRKGGSIATAIMHIQIYNMYAYVCVWVCVCIDMSAHDCAVCIYESLQGFVAPVTF